MLPDIYRRIVNAKYIFEQAVKTQAETAEMSLSIALLLAHDSIELLMLAVLDHVGAKPKTSRNFMDFWSDMKLATGQEPPDLLPMESLNKLRVGLKHNGNLPHSQTVRELIPRCRGFFDNVLQFYCQLKYEDISLLDLLSDSVVVSLLKKSEDDFQTGEKLSAMINLRFAFERVEKPDGKILPWLDAPKKPSVSFELRDMGLDRYVRDLHAFLDGCASYLNALMLKVDRLEMNAYMRVGPHIQWTMDGQPHVLYSDTFDGLTREQFDRWKSFVVDFAFKAEALYVPKAWNRDFDGDPRQYSVDLPKREQQPQQ